MGRPLQAEALGHGFQIQGVDVEHIFEIVSGVGVQVGLEGTGGLAVQITILFDKKLKLFLDIFKFALIELILVEIHLGLQQMLQVRSFFLHQQK